MRFFLIFLVAIGLAGCASKKGPLLTYFIGATRFTSGNRTGVGPADTLATRFYVDASNDVTMGLKNVRITVDYSPQRRPFLYPTPITSRLPDSVATSEQVVYMDSTFTSINELLLTTVYGVRTTAGTERWTFTATDNADNTSARTFVITQRRGDSTTVYNSYTLRLPVPATSKAARRFLDLKSGLALPGFTVAGRVSNPELQQLTDVIVLPDGLTLASPDDLAPAVYFKSGKWMRSSVTRFSLTALTPTTFAGVTDAVGLQSAFVGPGSPRISGLVVDQVYAFYVTAGTGSSATQLYGLMRIAALPAGTTAGLQLEIRIAKPAA
jgi:hypothetical protein